MIFRRERHEEQKSLAWIRLQWADIRREGAPTGYTYTYTYTYSYTYLSGGTRRLLRVLPSLCNLLGGCMSWLWKVKELLNRNEGLDLLGTRL
jgi:hypothetical protein